MARLALSSFVLLAVAFLSTPSVMSQGFGLIQNDFERYIQLFKAGKEPNLSHHPKEGNANWRKLYRDHNWKGYAEETEHREPLLAAQVLMGIYLTSFVDHELSYQIDSIVMYKAHFSPILAERITLDRIALYMQSAPKIQTLLSSGQGMSFYSEDELEKMQLLGRDIDIVARKRMVSGVPITRRQDAEIRSVTNLFHQDINCWAATYYFMREKFLVLDELADSFAFNWDSARRTEELQKLLDDDEVKRIADERVRNLKTAAIGAAAASTDDPYGGGGYSDEEGGSMDFGEGLGRPAPRGLTPEDIAKLEEEMPRTVALEMLARKEARHNAYRYIVGVYQGSEYHLETLRKIYRYFSTAAKQGDPIAQYHLALFLRYLGDIVDDDKAKNETEHEAQEWLSKAETTEWAKGRVEELRSYFAQEKREDGKRTATREKRLGALRKVEEDKLDMIDEVLVKVSQNIGSGSTTNRTTRGGTEGGEDRRNSQRR